MMCLHFPPSLWYQEAQALKTGPPGMGQVTIHSWGLLSYNPFPLLPSVPGSIKGVSAG